MPSLAPLAAVTWQLCIPFDKLCWGAGGMLWEGELGVLRVRFGLCGYMYFYVSKSMVWILAFAAKVEEAKV